MSFEQGTATSYTDLLDKLDAFLRKGHTLTPAYTGTGTGSITALMGTGTSVQETITVTFTSSTAFSVAGSVTGAMGTGTVGTPFSHARCTFTVVAGGVAWATGDTIAFVMTPPWVQQRGVAGSEYIWKAPGNANTNAIYVGAKTFFNASADYYNWRLQGYTGYSSGAAFDAQPGAITDPIPPCLPLWNQSIPYWFFANGQRVIVVAKVSTSYEMAYLGFLDGVYMSPGEYPYPLVVAGSMSFYAVPAANSASWRWSNTNTDQHANFWHASYDQTAKHDPRSAKWRMRGVDGSWKGFSSQAHTYNDGGRHGLVWPFSHGMGALRRNLDGTYPLFAILAHEAAGDGGYNVFGELGSIAQITGDGNASENTSTVGRQSWLVVQNAYQTGSNHYCAVRMD